MRNKTFKAYRIAIWIYLGLHSGCVVHGVSDKSQKHEKALDIQVAPPSTIYSIFELGSVQTPTADTKLHFVSVTIALGYEKNSALAKELILRKNQIEHIVKILVSEKTYNKLKSAEDRLLLMADIKTQLNGVLQSGKIQEVYFRKFIVN